MRVSLSRKSDQLTLKFDAPVSDTVMDRLASEGTAILRGAATSGPEVTWVANAADMSLLGVTDPVATRVRAILVEEGFEIA